METIELIKQARAGDKLAREQVIKQNMPLVYSIVRRFTGRGHDLEDLGQIGAIGLIKAVDNFNLDFEVKFSTYAVPLITGEIKRFLRDDGMVKVSRTLKENGYRIRREAEILAGRLGREAPLQELFGEPKHPYTRALLDTIPTIRDDESRQLMAIPGMVPENYDDMTGCRFADRCPYRREECGRPQELYRFGEGHAARCIVAFQKEAQGQK